MTTKSLGFFDNKGSFEAKVYVKDGRTCNDPKKKGDQEPQFELREIDIDGDGDRDWVGIPLTGKAHYYNDPAAPTFDYDYENERSYGNWLGKAGYERRGYDYCEKGDGIYSPFKVNGDLRLPGHLKYGKHYLIQEGEAAETVIEFDRNRIKDLRLSIGSNNEPSREVTEAFDRLFDQVEKLDAPQWGRLLTAGARFWATQNVQTAKGVLVVLNSSLPADQALKPDQIDFLARLVVKFSSPNPRSGDLSLFDVAARELRKYVQKHNSSGEPLDLRSLTMTQNLTGLADFFSELVGDPKKVAKDLAFNIRDTLRWKGDLLDDSDIDEAKRVFPPRTSFALSYVSKREGDGEVIEEPREIDLSEPDASGPIEVKLGPLTVESETGGIHIQRGDIVYVKTDYGFRKERITQSGQAPVTGYDSSGDPWQAQAYFVKSVPLSPAGKGEKPGGFFNLHKTEVLIPTDKVPANAGSESGTTTEVASKIHTGDRVTVRLATTDSFSGKRDLNYIATGPEGQANLDALMDRLESDTVEGRVTGIFRNLYGDHFFELRLSNREIILVGAKDVEREPPKRK